MRDLIDEYQATGGEPNLAPRHGITLPPGPLADLTDRQLLNSVDRSHPEVRELARRFEDAIEAEYIVRELLRLEREKNARRAPIRDALEARARAAGQVA